MKNLGIVIIHKVRLRIELKIFLVVIFNEGFGRDSSIPGVVKLYIEIGEFLGIHIRSN